MRAVVFDQDSPAGSIDELLSFLRTNDDGQYCYRGQNAHFGKILPSLYRLAINGNATGHPRVWEIDEAIYSAKTSSEREILRARLRHELIERLGKGVGNIVAQQYGLSSETLDVTRDPIIAGYFATRVYPNYSHFDGSGTTAPGVIYRIRVPERSLSLEQLEYKLGGLGHRRTDMGEDVWFETYARREDPDQPGGVQAYLEKYGREELDLFTHPIIVDYSTCRSLLGTALERAYKFTSRALDNTRLARQQGGFIRPSVHWRCVVPAKRRVIEREYLLDRSYYEPSHAVAHQILGIDDIHDAFPVEIFYFKHGKSEVDGLSREYLWPSAQHDDLYDLITDMCHDDRAISEYIEREDTWIDHFSRGIIDRGYSAGDEEIALSMLTSYQAGDYRSAIDAAKKALAIDPNSFSHQVMLGSSHLAMQEYSEAETSFRKALAIDPSNWNAYLNLATLYAERGDHDEALRLIDSALRYNDRRSEIYFQQAIILMHKKDYAGAVKSLDKARNFLARSGKAGMSIAQLSMEIDIRLATCHYITSNDDALEDVIAGLKSAGLGISRFRAHLQTQYKGLRAQERRRQRG
jgi:tetratricopeptide (TPR) repeat protein